ncbi:hypothetical protein RND81_12G233200 [Saponaria officinalis]|uniref:Uncharacterized protein n=1 Tax=Saponaria officinalis TaxID=3572 RepID=A0AAW1HEC4_SAPOF
MVLSLAREESWSTQRKSTKLQLGWYLLLSVCSKRVPGFVGDIGITCIRVSTALSPAFGLQNWHNSKAHSVPWVSLIQRAWPNGPIEIVVTNDPLDCSELNCNGASSSEFPVTSK